MGTSSSSQIVLLIVAETSDGSWVGEIAVLLFVGLFSAIVFNTFRGKNQAQYESAACLPLEDDQLALNNDQDLHREESAP